MSNRYCNLPGPGIIKETFGMINTGFDGVQADVDGIKSNPTFTGDIITTGGEVFVQTPDASSNANIFFRDSTGKERLCLFWDRITGNVGLQRRNASGSVESYIQLTGTDISFGNNLMWHAGNNAASIASTNGYQKLASGLIIQWGIILVNNGATGTITFPIAFPNAYLSIQATLQAPMATVGCTIAAPSITGFTTQHNSTGPLNIHWIAVGR